MSISSLTQPKYQMPALSHRHDLRKHSTCLPRQVIIRKRAGLLFERFPNRHLCSTIKICICTKTQLVPGCSTFKDYLSCSYLVNLCVYSLVDMNTPECKFFTGDSTSFLYSNTTSASAFSLAAGKQSTLNLTLLTYLSTGNFLQESMFTVNDIMRCGTPSLISLQMAVGNNIKTTCSFNFDNLVNWTTTKTYKNLVYQLFAQGNDGQYYEVQAYLQGATLPTKRYFL